MKRSNAIVFGISTLALAAAINGAFAESIEKSQPRLGTEVNSPAVSGPSINVTTTTSMKSLTTTPAATSNADRPDAIVTSSASANSVGDAQSNLDVQASNGNSALSKWSLRFDSIYFGASVSDPGGLNSPSDTLQDGGQADRVFIRNMPSIGYYINPDLLVGAVTRVDLFPTHQVDYGFEDSYVRLQAPKLVSYGAFNMVGDFRVYLPTAAYQQTNGEVFGIQTRIVPSYVVPNSRFTLAMVLYHQWTSHSDKVDNVDAYAKNAWDSEIYAGPNISYQMTPTLALTALYEFDAVQLANTPFGTYISNTTSLNGYTDFEPGVSWDVTPNVNISPFLNMYPGSNLSLDTTSINVWFSFKLI
jgi:hypothetical protein